MSINQDNRDGEKYVSLFRSGFLEPHAWVMFANGTSVVIVEPSNAIEEQARKILADTYPSNAHLDYEDVGIRNLANNTGWLITSKNPDICNLILIEDIEVDSSTDTLSIAVYAKRLRRQDWLDRRVIHVEPAKKDS